MSLRLGLMRHGLAAGQESSAPLLGPGRAAVRGLAEQLARDGFKPVAAFASPYLRARDSAKLLLDHLAPGLEITLLSELIPEGGEEEARATLAPLLPASGDVVVVSHLPLIARLARAIAPGNWEFSPGTWLEIEIDNPALHGRALRRIVPGERH